MFLNDAYLPPEEGSSHNTTSKGSMASPVWAVFFTDLWRACFFLNPAKRKVKFSRII
jgi:hypothetical protein